MSDRVFYPGAIALALAMIVLALVWPQGQGRRSPGPFGHAEIVTESARADFKQEAEDRARKAAAEAKKAALRGAQGAGAGPRRSAAVSNFDAAAVGRRVLDTEVQALRQMAEGLGEAFNRAVEVLHAAKGRVVCTGVGKSGHVARKIAATLASTGEPALFVHGAEASHGDLGMIGTDDAVLALSKSGETRELADVVGYAKRFGIPLIGVTARADSALGRAADVLLLLPDAPEAAAAVDAPTTSTTLQIALGDALAVALLERRGFTAGDFRVFHPGGKLGSLLRTAGDLMHSGAEIPLVAPDASMPEALLVMTEKRFGCVGVVEDGRLAGLITDGDLRRHMEGLLGHRASEVMTRDPRTATPQTLAGEALKLMNDRSITVLFVVDDQGRPVGILHVHDLLRAGVI